MTQEEKDIQLAQDESWQDGYFSGRDGDAREVPPKTRWPSHWLIGYDAAVEDKQNKMTQKLLDSLVGMSYQLAELLVRNTTGRIPCAVPVGQPIPMITRPRDEVLLRYDELGMVVSASTQGLIDAKYSED